MANELQWLDYLERCKTLNLAPQEAENLKNYVLYKKMILKIELEKIERI